MTAKERAYLKKEANGMDAVYQVGKNGVDQNMILGVGQALKAREMVKVSVQDASPCSARAAAALLSEKLGAETVQVIGKRFILYKRNREINRYGVV